VVPAGGVAVPHEDEARRFQHGGKSSAPSLSQIYHSIDDAPAELGGVAAIRDTFVGFQRFLSE
jgi:hypothetical protein